MLVQEFLQDSEHIVEGMTSQPVKFGLDAPPPSSTEEELVSALSKFKKGKTGWKSGIPPELIAYGGADQQHC